MKYLSVLILSAAGIVATATGGSAQPGFPSMSLLQAERAAGQQLFKDHCVICHIKQRGAAFAFGPSLAGVVGRPAASVAGFPYSDALKKSGLVWTEDNLRKWIGDATHTVPNTLMPHVSFADPAEQIYVVEYLKTLKAPAGK